MVCLGMCVVSVTHRGSKLPLHTRFVVSLRGLIGIFSHKSFDIRSVYYFGDTRCFLWEKNSGYVDLLIYEPNRITGNVVPFAARGRCDLLFATIQNIKSLVPTTSGAEACEDRKLHYKRLRRA